MRAFFIEFYFYRFKHFYDDVWCFLHSTGDETLKIGLPPVFYFLIITFFNINYHKYILDINNFLIYILVERYNYV